MISITPASNGYYCPDDPGEPGTDNEPRWSVSDLEVQVLIALVRGLDVLEIGTGLGYSAIGMADSAKSVTTVDIDPWVAQNVAPLLPDNVAFVDYLPDREFDVVFIDGQHTPEQVEADTRYCLEHLRPRGLIIWHDVKMDDVREGIERAGVGFVYIDTGAGLGINWKAAE